MAFWVYMLECADRSFYVGHTDNLEQRIACHQAGEIPGYTAERLPVSLVLAQAVESREQALNLERQLKGWSRVKKQALLAGDWPRVSALAKNDFSKRAP